MDQVKANGKSIQIPDVAKSLLRLKIVGDTSLIVNRFYQLPGPQDDPHPNSEKLTYAEQFKLKQYFWDDKHWFPSKAFKAAAVQACRHIDKIPMTLAKTAFQVVGEYVELDTDEPVMRVDNLPIKGGISKPTARPEYHNWSCSLEIIVARNVLTPKQVIHIFQTAGFASGLGEDRPNRTGGNHGMFHVGDNVEGSI